MSGLVETIYAMRNALLHGEVEPDAKVLVCYEPAYRIVMQFLSYDLVTILGSIPLGRLAVLDR